MGEFFLYFCAEVRTSWLLPIFLVCRAGTEEDWEGLPIDENTCVGKWQYPERPQGGATTS